MPLKLALKPGEAVIVNGAVLRNGDRRVSLCLENQARVLREKDVIRPETAQTPVQQTYFALMQMYLTLEVDGPLYDQVISGLCQTLLDADPEEAAVVLAIGRACAAGETYQALSLCRKLLKSMTQECGGSHG